MRTSRPSRLPRARLPLYRYLVHPSVPFGLSLVEPLERGVWTYSCQKGSEKLQIDGQVLFGILPYGLYQFAGLYQQLVGVVVNVRILQQFSNCALTGIQTIGQIRDLVHGVVQLVG